MKYFVERQILKLVGNTVRTYDENRKLICKAEQKAFKLKEQIHFFKDEEKTDELFSIKARKVIDISATYDIFDKSGKVVASLRRKGLASSFVRDEWLILNDKEEQIGSIVEDSNLLGLLRRYLDFVALFVPQKFHVFVGEKEVGTMQQNKNPLTVKLACDFNDGIEKQLGSLLPIAIPSMIIIIEARQG